MKQSELNYKENGEWCVWVVFEELEFYWERFGTSVKLSGGGYEQQIPMGTPVNKEPTAAEARKAIVKWLGEAFGI